MSAKVKVKAKQCSQRSVIGGVTKIYYFKLLRASEGVLVPAAYAVVSTHSSFKEGWRQAGLYHNMMKNM
jgi:hypothetical protein